ncbi:MAG TPA: RES family NAD+ phosphorylase, partial [Myxococcaceae bacterium]|nr:RES family NAD+ phosphorylase [Myxococcaceae bacterium]
EARRTVFAEKAYYRFLFLSGTAAKLVPLAVEQTAFRAEVHSNRAIDLTAPPFDGHRSAISSKTSYEVSQSLGRAMRADGVEMLRYISARDSQQGANVALFTPRAFARPRPFARQTWICVADESNNIRFLQKQPFEQGKLSFSFERREFEVDGALPAPAL